MFLMYSGDDSSGAESKAAARFKEKADLREVVVFGKGVEVVGDTWMVFSANSVGGNETLMTFEAAFSDREM